MSSGVAHVFRRHLLLILTKRVHAAEGDIGVRDVMLPRRQELEVISLLQDRAVVGRYIQASSRLVVESLRPRGSYAQQSNDILLRPAVCGCT